MEKQLPPSETQIPLSQIANEHAKAIGMLTDLSIEKRKEMYGWYAHDDYAFIGRSVIKDIEKDAPIYLSPDAILKIVRYLKSKNYVTVKTK